MCTHHTARINRKVGFRALLDRYNGNTTIELIFKIYEMTTLHGCVSMCVQTQLFVEPFN